MITLLRNAELYDPAAVGRRHLLVGGETVLWVGRDVPALDGALEVTELDLGGRRVIPGLIDGHVHLTGGGGEAGPETRVPPPALSRLTHGGVKTAVGVRGPHHAVRQTAELVTVGRGRVAPGTTGRFACSTASCPGCSAVPRRPSGGEDAGNLRFRRSRRCGRFSACPSSCTSSGSS